MGILREIRLSFPRRLSGAEFVRTLLWFALTVALTGCTARSVEYCRGHDAACSTVGLKIAAAWHARRGSTNIYVVLVRVGPDGKLAEAPTIVESTPDNGDPQWAADRDEAIKAVYRAQPFDVSAAGLGPMEVRLDPRAPSR
jgi:hypothetical protein